MLTEMVKLVLLRELIVGAAKEEMMRQQDLEPMYEWIEENFGDDAGEEDSEAWNEAVRAFEAHCEHQQQLEYESYLQDELEWYIYSSSQIASFQRQMTSVKELMEVKVGYETHFSLLVMLHAHTVAAIESYLASTFIHKVTNSPELIRKLVESDPEFSQRKFTLKEIFEKQESLKLTVATYLKNMIFHNLEKVKPMFKEVLKCDFGDITWLFEAVGIRHHCVHRAGIDHDGERVALSVDSIRILVQNSTNLVNQIEHEINENELLETTLY